MRGIILNDLYNILHNAKQMVLVMAIWAVCFFPGTDGSAYIVMCSVMFSMMTATTMSFDEKCNWTKYAMILPAQRRDYVFAKYVEHILFTAVGCLLGTAITVLVNAVRGRSFEAPFFIYSGVGFAVAMIFGSFFIPLLLKFGVEKARIIILGVVALPALAGWGIYYIAERNGMRISEQMLENMLKFSPILVLILVIITTLISICIFQSREF